jgi:hypothetical protein
MSTALNDVNPSDISLLPQPCETTLIAESEKTSLFVSTRRFGPGGFEIGQGVKQHLKAKIKKKQYVCT